MHCPESHSTAKHRPRAAHRQKQTRAQLHKGVKLGMGQGTLRGMADWDSAGFLLFAWTT